MKGTIIRGFNEREREIIEEKIALNSERPKDKLKKPPHGCLMAFGLLALILGAIWGPKAMLFSLVVVFAFVIITIVTDLEWAKKSPEIDKKLREILDDNRVEVARFEDVVPVIDELDRIELFGLGDDRILTIPSHPEYFPVPIYGMWPNDCFEIVKTVKHGLWLGIFCYGEKVNFKYEKGIYEYEKGELPEWVLRIYSSAIHDFPAIYVYDKHSNGEPIKVLEGKGWGRFCDEI